MNDYFVWATSSKFAVVYQLKSLVLYLLDITRTYYENHPTVEWAQISMFSALPNFVTEFSNILESLNIKLVAFVLYVFLLLIMKWSEVKWSEVIVHDSGCCVESYCIVLYCKLWYRLWIDSVRRIDRKHCWRSYACVVVKLCERKSTPLS